MLGSYTYKLKVSETEAGDRGATPETEFPKTAGTKKLGMTRSHNLNQDVTERLSGVQVQL